MAPRIEIGTRTARRLHYSLIYHLIMWMVIAFLCWRMTVPCPPDPKVKPLEDEVQRLKTQNESLNKSNRDLRARMKQILDTPPQVDIITTPGELMVPKRK